MAVNATKGEAAARLDDLARAGLVRRGATSPVGRVVPTGVAGLDAILPGGGLPCGVVTEIAGPASCGKLGLATRLLIGVLRDGERAAFVDTTRAFFPALSPSLTLALARLLVSRVPTPLDGIVAAEMLAASGGIALVVVDLVGLRAGLDPAVRTALARLDRALRENAAVAAVVTQPGGGAEGLLGAAAGLRLEVEAFAARRSDGRLGSRVTLARSRFGPPGASVAIA